MSRLERPESSSSNPAKRFIEWKSNDECFSYYDKAIADELAQEGADAEEIKEKANVKIKLPLKVLFLEHYGVIKGWDDTSKSGIWSNEVFETTKEPLTVKSKGGEIAKGLYKNIKATVKEAGGNFHRSIYVMLEDGVIANIALKGACLGGIKKEKSVAKVDHPGYYNFIYENSNRLENHWIVIEKAHKGKSGSVKFSIPDFAIGERITEDVDCMAIDAAAELQRFVNSRYESVEEDIRENSEASKYLTKSEEANLDEVEF